MKKVTKKPTKSQDKMNIVIGMLSFIIIVQIVSLASQSLRNYNVEVGQASATSAVQSNTRNDGGTGSKLLTVNSGLVINEIKYTELSKAPGTGGGDPVVQPENDDRFIELLNINKTDSITLTDGWTMVLSTIKNGNSWQDSFALKADSATGQTIKPGKYFTICFAGKTYAKKCDQTISAKYSDYFVQDFNFWLSAPNSTVPQFIQHKTGQNSYWPDGDAVLDSNLSLQLIDPSLDNSVGMNWCAFSPTLGTINTKCPQKTNNITINEIHYTINAKLLGDRKYIELYNNSDKAITLAEKSEDPKKVSYHLSAEGAGWSFPIGPGVIPAHGYWLICDTPKPSAPNQQAPYKCDQTTPKPAFDTLFDFMFAYRIYQYPLQKWLNIDWVNHWFYKDQVTTDNKWGDAAVSLTGLESLSLKDASLDNNNALSWCKTIPSPGKINTQCK